MRAWENPLLHQQQRMSEILKREFGPEMDSEPMVLVGDFNIPSKVRLPIIGGTPKMFKLLQGPLSSALDKDDDTFPTRSTLHSQSDFNKKHPLQIDHVFFNRKIKGVRAEVIHLKGSDHYPLLMVID